MFGNKVIKVKVVNENDVESIDGTNINDITQYSDAI